MTFNIFTTKRVSCFGQYDRIDDLITCKLSGDKCPVFRQFLVDEFHLSAVFKCFDPLLVWHFRISSGEIRVCREYTLFGARNDGWGMKSRLFGIWHSNAARRTTPEDCPCRESLPERTTPESLDGEGRERLDLPLCCLHAPNIQPELPHLAKLIVRTVQIGTAEPFFPSLCCIC
jgi:hypothetical protein